MLATHEKKKVSARQEARINYQIARNEQNYAVSDKQDVLAMCALQFASKHEIANIFKESDDEEALQKINELINLVNTHLE